MKRMKRMKKLLTAILSFTALSLSTGAAVALSDNTARADSSNSPKTELLLPSTYEQYLPLVSPSSAAVNPSYTAIADGNLIYVYDRYAKEYKTYEHSQNAEEKRNLITKIEFSEDGKLYFLDAATNLYVLNPVGMQAASLSFSCSSFALYGSKIYFLTISNDHSQISVTDLSTLGDLQTYKTVCENLGASPTFALYESKLYYLKNDSYLYEQSLLGGNPVFVYEFDRDIASLSLDGNLLFCVDKSGNFFAYSYAELLNSDKNATVSPVYSDESGDYSSLSSFGDYVYAVTDSAVRQFSAYSVRFTDFEISSSSSSQNRLSNAKDLHLSGELLLALDEGNRRVSLYDTSIGASLAPISLPEEFFNAKYLSATADTALVANATTALLYDLDDPSAPLLTLQSFKGNLVGATAVYDSYYFVTDQGEYYRLPQTEDPSPTDLESASKKNTHTLRMLTSDAYGNLYVGAGNEVYRYDEASFMTAAALGEAILSDLPVSATKLAVDYEQTLYALSDGKLLRFDEEKTSFDMAKSLVYSQDSATPLTSFAFSVEENATYLLYDGNFIAVTDELALPTVKTIPVHGSDEKIFEKANAEFSVVSVKEKTLAVEFDVQTLENAEYFPYLSHELTTERVNALKIGATDEYNVLAILDKATHKYRTWLVLKTACEDLPETDYLDKSKQFTGYLSNKVNLYKFPYLTELLTVAALPKSGKVTVLGEITRLDYDYYHVAFETENGETVTGYVPKPYVNEFDGSPKQPTKKTLGDSSTGDAIARLAFILLGLGAVGILIDFLILRKKPDERDD